MATGKGGHGDGDGGVTGKGTAMTVQLPAGLQKFFKITLGMTWPEGSEAALKAMSAAWADFQTESGDAADDIEKIIPQLHRAMRGVTAGALRDYLNEMATGLREIETASGEFAKMCKTAAADIQKTKIMFIVMAALILATIIELAASLFGAFAIPGTLAAGRIALQEIWKAVVRKIAQLTWQQALKGVAKVAWTMGKYAAGGAAFMGGLDLGIQGFQIASGGRDEVDWNSVKGSVIGGAIGGAAFGAFHGITKVGLGALGSNVRNKAPGWVRGLGQFGYAGAQVAMVAASNPLVNKATGHDDDIWAGILGGASPYHSSKGTSAKIDNAVGNFTTNVAGKFGIKFDQPDTGADPEKAPLLGDHPNTGESSTDSGAGTPPLVIPDTSPGSRDDTVTNPDSGQEIKMSGGTSLGGLFTGDQSPITTTSVGQPSTTTNNQPTTATNGQPVVTTNGQSGLPNTVANPSNTTTNTSLAAAPAPNETADFLNGSATQQPSTITGNGSQPGAPVAAQSGPQTGVQQPNTGIISGQQSSSPVTTQSGPQTGIQQPSTGPGGQQGRPAVTQPGPQTITQQSGPSAQHSGPVTSAGPQAGTSQPGPSQGNSSVQQPSLDGAGPNARPHLSIDTSVAGTVPPSGAVSPSGTVSPSGISPASPVSPLPEAESRWAPNGPVTPVSPISPVLPSASGGMTGSGAALPPPPASPIAGNAGHAGGPLRSDGPATSSPAVTAGVADRGGPAASQSRTEGPMPREDAPGAGRPIDKALQEKLASDKPLSQPTDKPSPAKPTDKAVPPKQEDALAAVAAVAYLGPDHPAVADRDTGPGHVDPSPNVPGDGFARKGDVWQQRRDAARPTRFSSERFEPSSREGGLRTEHGQVSGKITQIRSDLRHFEVEPGKWVLEFTVPLDLISPDHVVDAKTRRDRADQLQQELDEHFNYKHNWSKKGPFKGSQLHFTIEAATPNGVPPGWDADPSRSVPVEVRDSAKTDGVPETNQVQWDLADPIETQLHEYFHFLGLWEGYDDKNLLFNRAEGRGGIMGTRFPDGKFLTPEHLALIEKVHDQARPVISHSLTGTGTRPAPIRPVPTRPAPTLAAPGDLITSVYADGPYTAQHTPANAPPKRGPDPDPSRPPRGPGSGPSRPPRIATPPAVTQDFAADVGGALDAIFTNFPRSAEAARQAVEDAAHRLDAAEENLERAVDDYGHVPSSSNAPEHPAIAAARARVAAAEAVFEAATGNLDVWDYAAQHSEATYEGWLRNQFSDAASLHSTDDAASAASEPSNPNPPQRLEDVLPRSEWWRLYLDPRHHAIAAQSYPDNPGSYYDNDQSPGFQASMEAAYDQFLNPENFTSQRLNSQLYRQMHEVVTSRLEQQFGWSGRGTTGFPLRGDRPSPDVLAETVDGRPLLIDAAAFLRGGNRVTVQPIAILDTFSFRNPTIRTNYHHNEVQGIVDAVFDRFYADLENATTDADRFRAIGRVVRTVHIVHPFEDANRRLNVHVLLPRLLLEAGFQPVIFQDMDQLFQGGRSLDQIADALARGQGLNLTDDELHATAPEYERHSDPEPDSDSDADEGPSAPSAPAPDTTPQPPAPPVQVTPTAPHGPAPERTFDFAPGATELTGPQRAELDSLANDLTEARAIRDERGYQHPAVTVTGAHAQSVVDILAGNGIEAQARPGRADGVDVHVDWDLKRPQGYVPPEPPRSAKVADTVITSPAARGPHPVLDDPSWRHSTAPSANWFDVRDPVPSQDIVDARVNAPVTSTVRGEDGGVLSNSAITPDGVNLKAWRGPIAYDVRTMDINGVKVQDFTVKLHLDGHPNDIQAVQDRTRAGVEELFNQGNRLPGGAQFHVTVEFTGNPAAAHGAIKITDPGGRANQLSWPVDTDPRRLAHEVGHFLGLHDEYFEPGAVKPIFQHQDGKGRVVADNAPMTDGIDAPNASLKPRNLWLVENRMKAMESFNVDPANTAHAPVGPNTLPPNVEAPNGSNQSTARALGAQPAVGAPEVDVNVPKVADSLVEDLFNTLDAQVETAPRPPHLRDGAWSSPRPADAGPLTPQRLETEFGMPVVNQQRFQKLADRFNLVYDVRPTNPDSVRWLQDGAVPKPKDIKAKTISSLDVPLGASRDTIGLVGYFDPQRPDLDSLPPQLRDRVRQRYENRRREFAELAAEFADLHSQDRYRIENGIVQANTPTGFKHITGDHDVYHIRLPDDGSSLATDDYELDVWLLTKRNLGVQHGAHMYWEPQGPFQEKIFNDIVTRHQQTAPDAEPLIRFSPGEPPSLVYADPPRGPAVESANPDAAPPAPSAPPAPPSAPPTHGSRRRVPVVETGHAGGAQALPPLVESAEPQVPTLDYQHASDGQAPQFTRHGRHVVLETREDRFPSVLPVVETSTGGKPPMMFSADSTIGLPLGDRDHSYKEFYATPQVVADANARLKEVNSKLRLRVASGNTVTHGGTVLVMVTPHFDRTPPGVCSEFSQNIIGGSHSQVVLRPPDAAPVMGKIANGGPLQFFGTHELANVIAEFVRDPDAVESITPHLVSDTVSRHSIDPPLPGREYGTALRPGTDERARLDRAAEQLGVNQYGWGRPGEAYVIQSIAAPDEQGANFGLNYARTGNGEQLTQVWGYHFGSVAVNNAADDMQITVESVRQGGYRKHVLDQVIKENLNKYWKDLPHLKQRLQTQPGITRAQLDLVDALASIRDIRIKLIHPATMGSVRQIAEVDLQNAELAARQAISKIAGDRLPPLGQMWFLGYYGKAKGESFFDKWGHVDAPNIEAQIANPLAAVTVANTSASKLTVPMGEVKDLHPAQVAVGAQTLPGIAGSMLTGLAKSTAEAALWRNRNHLPLPQIRVHGYGNDTRHADLAAAWTRAEMTRLLTELQSDLPPGQSRLTADQIQILPGRQLPLDSRNPESAQKVHAEMTPSPRSSETAWDSPLLEQLPRPHDRHPQTGEASAPPAMPRTVPPQAPKAAAFFIPPRRGSSSATLPAARVGGDEAAAPHR